jgi:hypothetical protein
MCSQRAAHSNFENKVNMADKQEKTAILPREMLTKFDQAVAGADRGINEIPSLLRKDIEAPLTVLHEALNAYCTEVGSQQSASAAPPQELRLKIDSALSSLEKVVKDNAKRTREMIETRHQLQQEYCGAAASLSAVITKLIPEQ